MATTKPFAGRVITITGAARGIGLATARYLAERGATVCIADVLKEDLTKAEESIKKDFPDVHVTQAEVDVSNSKAVDEWIKSVKEKFGKIDGCVNNAGIAGVLKPITELTDEEFSKVININLIGIFNCLRAQLRVMEMGGSIVNTASIAGLMGFANFSPYITSKHGIIGLTRTAAKEAGEKEIRVNAVCPGIIQTAMIDEINETAPLTPQNSPQIVKRSGKPEEIAALVAYLLGDESKYTTGAAMVADGGWVC
ncbi:NAD(P)-binding protein [Lepidopterella palustris CBS 459.81]|uniref:NAD(P)-binding protein n=1 Tax=Lepidopterella palustris CBS 459.81 TaxID=1314670 RepID=A0A8E2J983_9PEZI|nr:NAD(P)-binding protein [Lepidopterella palustris CBS 459.81]